MNPLNLSSPGLFQHIAGVPALYQAWRKVRANRGAAGMDAISLQAFEAELAANLGELSRCLSAGSYEPLPARFVCIVKENGKERELGILTVRDRVAQRAVLDAIEPLIEPLMADCSFAFRGGRNVEMAIQRMVAARANGCWWTVESDVEDFFGAIDRRLLLRELSAVVPDENVIRLIQTWLSAGALEEMQKSRAAGWARQGRVVWAKVRLKLGESVGQTLDDYVAQQLGVVSPNPLFEDGWADRQEVNAHDTTNLAEIHAEAQQQTRRAAVTRLIQDGALLAVSQRALLGKLLGAKVLGLGGIAVAGAMLAPNAVEAFRNYRQPPPRGTLQGAPISPLLTNFYMTPFDRALTQQVLRMIRYCDDFVLMCRSKAEAESALQAAQNALAERRLRVHPLKTRIVAPDEEFEFLGYVFAADGSVVPPPSVPAQMAQSIRQAAQHAHKRWGDRVKR